MNPRYQDIICARAGAKAAVLLLHGILSAPQFFDFLLPEIPSDISVYGILLDGHGDTPEALAHTSMQKWKQQVHDLAAVLTARYEQIIIAAHSMGTLFALQLARQYPEKISRMLLLGVPLSVHLTPFGAGSASVPAY